MSRSSDDSGLALLGGCLALLGLPLLFVLLYAFHGFTIAVFWAWFVTPLFGIKAPSIAACIGLGLLGKTLLGVQAATTNIKKEYREYDSTAEFVGMLILTGFIWLVAFICHLCI